MNTTIQGNITDITDGIIVHGCNAQGVMGSGVALAIKNKWPKAFEIYRGEYVEGGMDLGVIVTLCVSPNLWVVNAITQEYYRGHPSTPPIVQLHGRYVDYDAIRACFARVAILAKRSKKNIYYPKIGAGLGGGDWAVIDKIIHECLGGLNELGISHHLVELPPIQDKERISV